MGHSSSLINNTIALSVSPSSAFIESFAGFQLYPGMLITFGPSGSDKYWPSSEVGDEYSPTFAVENPYEGKTIYDPYEAESRVMIRLGRTGDVFLTKVTDMLGANLLYGDRLISNGDGWFKKWVAGDESWTVRSMEYEVSPTLPRWTRVMIK